MSLPPRFIRGDGSFEDWAEGFWYGCVRPDEKTEAIARAAWEAALTEATKAVEKLYADAGWNGHYKQAAAACSAEIRAMKKQSTSEDFSR